MLLSFKLLTNLKKKINWILVEKFRKKPKNLNNTLYIWKNSEKYALNLGTQKILEKFRTPVKRKKDSHFFQLWIPLSNTIIHWVPINQSWRQKICLWTRTRVISKKRLNLFQYWNEQNFRSMRVQILARTTLTLL